jgi:hypothetical protein
MNAPRGQPAVDSAVLTRACDALRKLAQRERGRARDRAALDRKSRRLAEELENLARDLSDLADDEGGR